MCRWRRALRVSQVALFKELTFQRLASGGSKSPGDTQWLPRRRRRVNPRRRVSVRRRPGNLSQNHAFILPGALRSGFRILASPVPAAPASISSPEVNPPGLFGCRFCSWLHTGVRTRFSCLLPDPAYRSAGAPCLFPPRPC